MIHLQQDKTTLLTLFQLACISRLYFFTLCYTYTMSQRRQYNTNSNHGSIT